MRDKIFTHITLENSSDLTLSRGEIKKANHIRKLQLEAVIEKGWKCRLVISENHQKLLRLPTKIAETVFYDDSSENRVKMAEAVELTINDRRTTICPYVMTTLNSPVVGAILLQELNLELNDRQEIILLDRVIKI